MHEKLNGYARAAEVDYRELINLPEGRCGKFSIQHRVEPPGFVHALSPLRATILAGQPAGSVWWDEETTWTALCEHDALDEPSGVWMTDAVCEQEQHWRALKGVSGTVLVGGLGLGMAVQILRRNPNVTAIMVVERERDVAEMVWRYVFAPGMELIVDDIHNVGERLRGSMFDWAFIDTWASDSQRTLFDEVIPIRQMLYRDRVARQVVCWNEDVMRGQLRMGLMGRFAELKLNVKSRADVVKVKRALVEFNDDRWHDWAVPFYQVVDRYKLWSKWGSEMLALMTTYAELFGLPGWEDAWKIAAAGIVARGRRRRG